MNAIVKAQSDLMTRLKLNGVEAAIAISKYETSLEVYVARAEDADNVPIQWQGYVVETFVTASGR